MIKWGIIVCLLFFVFQIAKSQTIERDIISSDGAEVTIDGIRISWTLGEPLINSYFSETLNFIEGYQQPDTDSISFILDGYDNEALIYPNPFSDNLYVELKTPIKKDIQLLFVNSLGQYVKRAYMASGINKIKIDVSELVPGYYNILFLDRTKISSVRKLLKIK